MILILPMLFDFKIAILLCSRLSSFMNLSKSCFATKECCDLSLFFLSLMRSLLIASKIVFGLASLDGSFVSENMRLL